jgi:hypothetical protein
MFPFRVGWTSYTDTSAGPINGSLRNASPFAIRWGSLRILPLARVELTKRSAAMPSVLEIFITDMPGQPMQSTQAIEAITGKGLKGDRNFRDASNPKRIHPRRK